LSSFRRDRAWQPAAALCVALGVLSGCAGDGYYRQSIAGEVDMMRSREDIAKAIADPSTPADLRRQLELVTQLVDFAVSRLALPDNGSYRSFVEIDRNYVVWNVIAAPPLSLDPVEWCFPVVGCVAYRGYFAEADAEAFADSLRAQGLDVVVSGAAAYSTLGWFDDPVPTTILFDPDYALARTIFHELAHQRVYIQDDSTFNESYAVAVEEAAVELWLSENGDAAMRAAYRRDEDRYQQFLALVLSAQAELRDLYQSGLGEEAMLARKQALFDGLRADYARLKSSWGGYSGYDRWFATDLNNAKLALMATYTAYVGAFKAMLADSGGDWAAFHAAVEVLSEQSAAERAAILEGFAAR
jgi:predicted aminopeptidase